MRSTKWVSLIVAVAALNVQGCSGNGTAQVTSMGGNGSGAGGLTSSQDTQQNVSGSSGTVVDVTVGGSNTTGGSDTVAGSSSSGGAGKSGGASAISTTATNGGGNASTGGMQSTGGMVASGGTMTVGGAKATGGARATGGTKATGGVSAQGGAKATGGTVSSSGGTSAAGTGAHTNPLSQALIDEFVVAHNAARSGTLNPTPNPPLPPVSWDYTLADVAYNYLSKCQGGSIAMANHNSNASKDYAALGGTDQVGENIYATSGKTVTPTDAVTLWMSEASSYDYNSNNIMAAGHYTQVVWRASVRIGCAIVNCPNYQYPNTTLCDYAPAGNYTNQKPY